DHHLSRLGRFQADLMATTHGTKQQCQPVLQRLQFDSGLGKLGISPAGDELVPDTAGPFFHFNGKTHGMSPLDTTAGTTGSRNLHAAIYRMALRKPLKKLRRANPA